MMLLQHVVVVLVVVLGVKFCKLTLMADVVIYLKRHTNWLNGFEEVGGVGCKSA